VEPTPTPAQLVYSNEIYGFEFTYPETYSLEEEDHGVVLRQGPLSLRINFRMTSEELAPYFGRTGFGGGDLIYEAKVNFMDQVMPVEALLYDLKYKAVLFNGTSEIEVDDLIFAIVLEDLYTDYELLDIPEGIRIEAKEIVESFKRIEALGLPVEENETEVGQPEDLCSEAYKDWNSFVNQEYSFCFQHPSTMDRLEEANVVKLSEGSMTLEVSFRMVDEDVELVAPGGLEGKFDILGPFTLFGEEIPGFINLIDGKVREVVYGNSLVELQAGDLRLYIRLFDSASEAGFDRDDFTQELQDTIAEILTTFERVEMQ
jgi:hypothetical protein